MRKQKKGSRLELKHSVSARIGQKKYDELQGMLGSSVQKTMSALLRHILENRKITLEYYDKTLDKVMLELSENRREIQSIGVNINQVAKRFHAQNWEAAMLVNAREIAGLYQRIDVRIQQLFDLITQIAQKWLPE